ncbi:MAG: ABC transporter substrate-binding protein [Defluviitaleaceae bacterium]|nr:ABC transporter substrate-binding protein [Defluviitaleaceae bacterium]
MKKLLIALLLLSLVLVFAACGRDNDEPEPEQQQEEQGEQQQQEEQQEEPEDMGLLGPHNPIEISMLLVTTEVAPAPGNRIAVLMEERLGVTISYEIVTPEMQAERISVLIAGGGAGLPDILATGEVEARLTEAGAKLRLDPFIDSGRFPNIYNHVAPYRARLSWRGGGVDDGLYTLPNYNRFYGNPPLLSPTHYGTGFFLQKRVLEWHGFPDLSNMTLERYFQLIEEFIMENPYTPEGLPHIGFTFPAFPGRVWGMTNPPMFLAGFPNDGGVIVRDGVASIYAGTEYDHRYFYHLNQMFLRNGLMPGESVLVDPEATTQSQDMYFANVANGRVLGMHDQRWGFGSPHDSLVATGQFNRTFVPTMPTFDGRAPWYADRDVMNIHQGFAISSMVSEERAEHLLAFVDTILSEEWQILLSWGQEGLDYHIGPDGIFYRTPEQRLNYDDTIWRQHNRLMGFLDMMPKLQGTLSCGNAFTPGHQPLEFMDGLDEYDRWFLEQYDKRTWRDFVNDPPPNPPHYPAWQISVGSGTPADMARSELEVAALQHLPAIIMAPDGQFDTRWADYIAHIDRIDVAAFEEAMTAGIQERIRNLGY